MNQEIERRRTFAIISHPDAGKTTLTEKFLLFGGQIQVAGAVKNNKIKKTATSDWMDIEKQRGISVSTSVMEFDYTPEGSDIEYKVNILDTPGHQDFAEDTFRTLTAVDSAIIVVDGAKGVETQTRKLMTVCRMRKTPVIIFINKMDREGRDPFDLLDELEQELEIKVRPLSWPINQGAKFKGVYNIYEQKLDLFTPDKQRVTDKVEVDINSDELDARVGEENAAKLREDLELVDGVYPEFDVETYRSADVAPVFFGSALNNFGVQELLNCFVEIAPSPRPTKAEERDVEPEEKKFTGFIFKITANIDPNHRSCIAFCKVCSGQFRRNQPYLHVRQGKTMRFSSPTQFMAQRKSTIDEAWPGDIVGLPDTGGVFKIGDTLTEGEQLHFRGLPSFSPELFKYIENDDPMKAKQLQKGIDQLMDEGVAQLFVNQFNNRKIIGTVGQLQFEVIQYRLENEYNAKCRWEPVHLYKACWIESDDDAELENFKKRKYQYMAKDKDGRDVFLADSGYVLSMAQEDFKHIKFHFTSIRNAIETMRKGGVILYPTDTVWGIGCDATNAEAVKRVYEIKQRDDSKALICLVDSDARMQRYFRHVPDVAWQLIDSLKEGDAKPTTLILDGAINLAENLIAEDGSLGIRITNEPFSKELCFRFQKAIVSTSANISGEPAAQNYGDIDQRILDAVDYVCWSRRQEHKPHTPSSIIKLKENGEVTIIRK